MVSFAGQQLVSLIRSYVFIFAFVSIALRNGLKKTWVPLRSESVLPLLSCSLMVSCLMFKSLSRFVIPLLLILFNSNMTSIPSKPLSGSCQQQPLGCEIHMAVVSPHLPWLISSIWHSWSLPALWDACFLETIVLAVLHGGLFWGSFAAEGLPHVLMSLAMWSRLMPLNVISMPRTYHLISLASIFLSNFQTLSTLPNSTWGSSLCGSVVNDPD